MGQEPQDNYTATDPKANPVAFIYENREALKRMPEDKAIKLMNRTFDRYMLPRYKAINKQGLSPDEISGLKHAFMARLLDIPTERQVKVDDPKEKKSSAMERGGATALGEVAGTLGGIRKFSELVAKIDKTDLSKDPVHKAISSAEGSIYSKAQEMSPGGAEMGAAFGHQVPATLAAEGAGGVVPKVAKGASTAVKAVSGAAKGAIEGATYGGVQGEGAKSNAMWGAVLGAAFPIVGKLFGFGKGPTAAVASEVAPTITKEVAGAVSSAPSKAPSSMGDLAEQIAQKKFGKSFKDLSPTERTTLPQHMKEEIKAQQSAKASAKKIEVDARRAAKEESAKKKAATQAEERKATVTPKPTSPVEAKATAAKAAEENPTIAKVVTPVEKRTTAGVSPTGTERRKTVYEMSKMSQPTEGEKLAADIKKQSAKTTTVTHQQVEKFIKSKDPKRWEAYQRMSQKEKDAVLIKMKPVVEKIQKIPEGEHGTGKIAQQAKDRERAASERASGKRSSSGGQELTGGGMAENILAKMATDKAKYTPETISNIQIPELEEAVKEMGGDMIIDSFTALRKRGKLSDVMYKEHLKEWALQQFEKGTP
jgi:hypothetical protein